MVELLSPYNAHTGPLFQSKLIFRYKTLLIFFLYLELDKGGKSNMIVTGGMDGRVIVWDKNMCISNLFSPAHPSGKIFVYLLTIYLFFHPSIYPAFYLSFYLSHPTQYYLVRIRLQHKISFATSFTFSK